MFEDVPFVVMMAICIAFVAVVILFILTKARGGRADDTTGTTSSAADALDLGPQELITVLALPLENILAAGRYTVVDELITTKNFPPLRSSEYDVSLLLAHFHREMRTGEVLTALAPRGYRPATIAELLAFGAQRPHQPRQFQIAALGSAWEGADDRDHHPYLDRVGQYRFVGLATGDVPWAPSTRFLVAAK